MVRRGWILLLLFTLLGGLLGSAASMVLIEPQYYATGRMFVLTEDTEMDEGMDATQVALGRALAKYVSETLINDALLDNVRSYFSARQQDRPTEQWEDLSLYTNTQLQKMLSASCEENSQTVVVDVLAPTASLACHLAEAVVGEAEVSVVSILGSCRIQTVDQSVTQAKYVGDSAFTVILFGAVVFFATTFVCLFLHRVYAPALRDSEEIAHLYGDAVPYCGRLPYTASVWEEEA